MKFPLNHGPWLCPLRGGEIGIEQGVALMLVLWIITLLTIIAVGLTTTQRTESALTANQLLDATFRAQAEAAINFTALNLLTQPPIEALADKNSMDSQGFWLPDGEPRLWQWGEKALEIRIINETSLIDLNLAEPNLLMGLMKAAGVQDPAPLVDAILDWRDLDELHLANGAEDEQYAAAGLPYGAKDGPFDSVEELGQVMGFDRDLYQALAPAFTVSSGQASPVVEFAPPLVQAALQGIGLGELEERLAQEAKVLGESSTVSGRGGPLYRIQVRWQASGEAYRSMEALAKIELGGQPSLQVLWRRYALGRVVN